MTIETIAWQDGILRIIDQTLLPGECKYIKLETEEKVWEAIKSLRVRGAPAIGICVAYGVLTGIRQRNPASPQAFQEALCVTASYLASSRPTAVNLFWAIERMKRAVADSSAEADCASLFSRLEKEAIAIHDEDRQLCRAIGRNGAALIGEGDGILTHCNAGGLATSGYGTALAVMFTAHEAGVRFHVFADETRPLLQGARLTAWELMNAGIDVTLICDNMAAQVMKEGKIQCVVVGADRIAANGDTANKIGTYGAAVLARAHGIPFYVAAPYSTFDLIARDGAAIPIELRAADEVTHGFGAVTAPPGVAVYNPAFDVTPAELIAGIITERGVLRPPYGEAIAAMAASHRGKRSGRSPCT